MLPLTPGTNEKMNEAVLETFVSFDKQRRVLDIPRGQFGNRLPILTGLCGNQRSPYMTTETIWSIVITNLLMTMVIDDGRWLGW